MIHLSKVCFSYGSKSTLKNIDFSIERTDRIAFIGPSGCGKSTLLEVILGYKKPTSGHILYPDDSNLSFGVAFQQNDLLPWMDVLSQVKMDLLFQDKTKISEATVLDLLKKLGLSGFQKHMPSELSGGQQKRVSLARALLQKPDLLLLDEPFVGVDQLSCELILKDLKYLVKEEKQTLILVTHHIQEAVFLAKKIVIFSESPGQVVAILENPFFEEEDFGALSLAAFAKTVRGFLK